MPVLRATTVPSWVLSVIPIEQMNEVIGVRRQVLFITDSLGFPRLEPEAVMYEDTYISLLKEEFPGCDFIHLGRGGATIIDLYKHSTYYHGTLKPDLVIMQCGIVDCAPRALTIMEQQVLTRLPVLGRPLTALVRRYSKALRKARKMTYTPVETFAQYVARFEALFDDVHWIGILPAMEAYDTKLEGIRRNIEIYNAVLRRNKYIDTGHFHAFDIMTDFHHLNCTGHRKMFEALLPIIRCGMGVGGSCRVASNGPIVECKDGVSVPTTLPIENSTAGRPRGAVSQLQAVRI